MHYKMVKPCSECPFLKGSGFTVAGLYEHASGEFGCHKACDIDEESGDFVPRENTPHCAGALIFLEKRGKPHQMMRICSRLHGKDGLPMYDPSKLDMRAKVR